MSKEAEVEGAEIMQGGHVVLFPFPASGHIAPFIPFAKSLARDGVAVTFLYPRHEFSNVKSLVEDDSFDARENVKLLLFEVPIEGGLNFASVNVLKDFMYENVEKFDAIVGRLMGESRTIHYPMQCEGGPPVCIVSDMFLGFTQARMLLLDLTSRVALPQKKIVVVSGFHFVVTKIQASIVEIFSQN